MRFLSSTQEWIKDAGAKIAAFFRSANPDHIALLVIVFLHVLYFSDILFKGYAYLGADLFFETFSTMQFSWESIVNYGKLPLWNPYIASGFINMDFANLSIFHPLNLLFLSFFPFKIAFNVMVVSNPLIAGISMFLYARCLRLSSRASFISAIAYSMSGFVIGTIFQFGSLQAVAYIPLLLYIVEKGFDQKRFIHFFWLVPVLILQNLGGHPQYVLYGGMLLLGYFIFKLYCACKNKEMDAYSIVKYIFLFFLLIGISLGICAFWILVVYNALMNGTHHGGSVFAASGSLNPLMLINFIFPHFFGKFGTELYWAKGLADFSIHGYVGLLALVLAIVAVVQNRRKNVFVNFYCVLVFLAIFFALGHYNPLFDYMTKLPIISFTRCFGRFTILYVFSVSILAGWGYQYLFENPVKEKFLKMIQCLSGFFIFGIISLIVFVRIFLEFFREEFLEFLKKIFYVHFFGKHPFDFRPLEYYEAIFDSYPQRIAATINIAYPHFLMSFLLALAIFLMVYCLRKKLFRRTLPYFVLLLIVIPLFYVGKTTIKASKDIWLTKKPNVVKAIVAHNKWREGRIFTTLSIANAMHISTDPSVQRELLLPSSNTKFGLFSINLVGYNSEGRYADIANPIITARTTEEFLQHQHLLNLLNVAYVISPADLSSAGLKEITKTAEYMHVYYNPFRLPRAFFVNQLTIETDDDRRLDLLHNHDFDFTKKAIVEEKVPLLSAHLSSASNITDLLYGINTITISARTEEMAFLVISDTYSKGWQCFIDGKKTKIYRTNHAFKGVVVPAGEHEIIFKYSPPGLSLGIIISMISFFIFLFLWGIVWFFNKKKGL